MIAALFEMRAEMAASLGLRKKAIEADLAPEKPGVTPQLAPPTLP